METVVYLFTGFLEAGKTRLIQETLQDRGFNDGSEKILLILCEEGEEEYETIKFAGAENVDYVVIEDKEQLTEEYLTELQTKYGSERVIVEYNGMWALEDFFKAMPEGWMINQLMTFFDARTILNYNANMRQLMVDKLTGCEMVVFNRTTPETDKMALHKLVRGVSRRANICYEDMAGEIEFDQIEDPLPFDINAPVIDIKDEDFAIFYRDMTEEFPKYNGKTVRFKGIVALDSALGKSQFAVGRHIMTCCADDIAYRGVVAKGTLGKSLKTRDWVIVEGKLLEENSPIYRGRGPVLTVTKLEFSEKPEQEVATFY